MEFKSTLFSEQEKTFKERTGKNFSTLYEKYFPKLVYFTAKICNDVQKAEDYIQSLLKDGLSRITANDEKDIEQYIREQNSSSLWGQKRTT